MRGTRLSLGFLVAALCSTAGCGETKYDIYMRGLEIEGEAERGPCALTYEKGEHAARLSTGKLTACLLETEKALALYQEAADKGHADADFKKVFARAKDRKKRIEQMIAMVGEMEKDAIEVGTPGAVK